jgi:putative SOS response-associated peptidase YedK
MPVVLPESAYSEWLDPANDDVATLSRMIETGSVTELRHYPVSLYVNNPRNEGPKCIEPLANGMNRRGDQPSR